MVTIIFSLVLFSACISIEEENDMIKYETGIYNDKNWNETIGTYDEAVISNEKTALEIAVAIFDGMKKFKDSERYIPQSVFYDVQDEIWIVTFGEEQKHSDIFIVGGGCNIAIQKKDGKVLRVWFDE